MTWTATAREHYGVYGQRAANRLSDAQWRMLAPFFPPASSRGRPMRWTFRQIIDAILYLLWTGCQWRALPGEFPPYSTVQRYFYRWRDDGTWERINHHLVMAVRCALCREASPTAGVIDSQSARATDVAGPRGYDAGKKIKGRKRHILTDTQGHLLAVRVHTADIQDRDGAPALLADIRFLYPWLRHVFADGGYAGEKLKAALAELGTWSVQIVKRSEGTKGFVPLPRRWVVERTFAWLSRCRRLAKDYEAAIASAQAWVYIASIRILLRKFQPKCL